MTDTKLNQFLASGTAAERSAFTPSPPTPASGPDPTYIWFETDTEDTYAWDFGASGWVQVNTAASSNGRLIGRQVITATGAGTYTPTAGTNAIVLEMMGGGGGGSGVASPTGSNVARGLGGGGGAYLRKRLTANFSGASYVVGAKGTGGAAGANAGASGADTTFTDTAGSPTIYTAGGGVGGSSQAALAAPFVASAVAGGTATNGDLNVAGGSAIRSFAISSTVVQGGGGGDSFYGHGANPAALNASNSTVGGSNATGFGAGGSSGAATGTGAAAAGGNGSDGLIIIWEYS